MRGLNDIALGTGISTTRQHAHTLPQHADSSTSSQYASSLHWRERMPR